MKIVVNTRLLRKGEMDGIGWFTFNTLQYIVKQHPHIEFHFLFDSGIDKEFVFADNIVPHNLFPPAKHAVLNLIWFEVSVRRLLNKINPDIFISPDGLLCLGWKGKQYGVMHDINYYHNPRDLKWSNRKYYNYFFPKYADQACRIGTVSEFSKDDIVQHYKISPQKIDVLYNGVNNFFHPISTEERNRVKAELTGGKDYFLFIGTLHPRKNIIRLLQAFDAFQSETGSGIKLVIAGKSLFKVDEIYSEHERLKYKADVIFAGRVADNKINDVLGAAFALTFVPTFEGFGIPIVEAMQCDVPVISSNSTSMPEVAGDAALLVDPFDVREIKEAMIKLYNDEAYRQQLIEKGRLRKNVFSWERTADLLWNSVTKCL
jgi:glycosyltransferase involved in cell wall biosynthesis